LLSQNVPSPGRTKRFRVVASRKFSIWNEKPPLVDRGGLCPLERLELQGSGLVFGDPPLKEVGLFFEVYDFF
jgi:hypothetical protein